MRNLIIVIASALILGGCASSGGNQFYEPYSPQRYNQPFLNGSIDSSIAIVRSGAKEAINRAVIKQTGRLFY